jgi:hypothetical protein
MITLLIDIFHVKSDKKAPAAKRARWFPGEKIAL